MSGVSITTSTSRVEVNTTSSTINIVPVGQQGIQGPVGAGVAAGGVAGDILVKTNSTNYATEWTDDITVDSITYDINAGIDPDTQGETSWSADERTLQINKGGGVLQYVSQDLSYPVVRNADTVTLTAGKLVMVDPSQPAQGQRLRVVRMNNNGTYPSDLFVGMVIETIAPNQTGFVKWFGQVKNLSLPTLQPVGETWAEGDILWPSTTVNGGMTKVEPSAPSNKISVAAVLRISGNQLNLLLRPNLRSKLVDLHDVQVTNPSNGQILNYSNGVWVNATNAPDGVQSVTGDGVGGTATNVVMTFPTPSEIGAYPDTNPSNFITSAQAPVQSVNGQTNVVVLDADDVGAYSNTNPSSFINAAGAPVQSVTGTLVTGTSANPVVNIPTVDQVGAYSNTNPSNFINVTQAAAAAPVQSVNGQTNVVVLTKTDVGLSNVDNTSDLNKPISTATQTALNLKYDASNPSNFITSAGAPVQSVTGTLVTGTSANPVVNTPTKTDIGLGNVDNTSDLNKPISTATQTGLDLKANKAGDTFTGLVELRGTTASDTAPLGSELTTTGTGANWTGSGFATGYTHAVGSTAALTTTLNAVNGTYYQIEWTVTGITAGTFTIAYGGISIASLSATGNSGPRATATTALSITPTTDFDGTIVLSIKTIGTSSATTNLATSAGTLITEIRANNINTNTLIGRLAGTRITTGGSNSFFGQSAGQNNTTGGSNSFFGLQAGSANTTGFANSFFGLQAGSANITGFNNSFFGVSAGLANTTGNNNSFFGVSAGRFNTTGGSNNFFGVEAGRNNTTGNNNAFFGVSAGRNNTTGQSNSFFGREAGVNNTTGEFNSFFGVNAGRFQADGVTTLTIVNNSVFLGNSTRANGNSQTNQIVIGDSAIGAGSNTAVLGNDSIIRTLLKGNVLINTSTDAGFRLDVNGTTQLQGSVTLTAGSNLILATATGTKIGTATNQLLAFYNANPIVQPTTGVAAAAFVANTSDINDDTATFDGYTIGQVVKALRNLGLLA